MLPQLTAAIATAFYCGCQHECKELWVNELLYIMLYYYSSTHYYCYLVKLLCNIQALSWLTHTLIQKSGFPDQFPCHDNFFFVSNHVKNEMNESIRKLVVWWVQSREEEEEETAGSSC